MQRLPQYLLGIMLIMTVGTAFSEPTVQAVVPPQLKVECTKTICKVPTQSVMAVQDNEKRAPDVEISHQPAVLPPTAQDQSAQKLPQTKQGHPSCSSRS